MTAKKKKSKARSSSAPVDTSSREDELPATAPADTVPASTSPPEPEPEDDAPLASEEVDLSGAPPPEDSVLVCYETRTHWVYKLKQPDDLGRKKVFIPK